jgi:hypothetical protein
LPGLGDTEVGDRTLDFWPFPLLAASLVRLCRQWLWAAVVWPRLVTRRFRVLLHLGPYEAPTGTVDWDAEPDCGAWDAVTVTVSAVRYAVVVDKSPDRCGTRSRPACPVESLQQCAVIGTGQNNLRRFDARIGAVPVNVNCGVDRHNGCRGHGCSRNSGRHYCCRSWCRR